MSFVQRIIQSQAADEYTQLLENLKPDVRASSRFSGSAVNAAVAIASELPRYTKHAVGTQPIDVIREKLLQNLVASAAALDALDAHNQRDQPEVDRELLEKALTHHATITTNCIVSES